MDELEGYFTEGLAIAQGYATYEGRTEVQASDITKGLRAHLLDKTGAWRTSSENTKTRVITWSKKQQYSSETAEDRAYLAIQEAQLQWVEWEPEDPQMQRLKTAIDTYCSRLEDSSSDTK